MEVEVNFYSAEVIKSIFGEMRGYGLYEITAASEYLYNFVKREGIYPPKVVAGFYSAMQIISGLTELQFLEIESLFAVPASW